MVFVTLTALILEIFSIQSSIIERSIRYLGNNEDSPTVYLFLFVRAEPWVERARTMRAGTRKDLLNEIHLLTFRSKIISGPWFLKVYSICLLFNVLHSKYIGWKGNGLNGDHHVCLLRKIVQHCLTYIYEKQIKLQLVPHNTGKPGRFICILLQVCWIMAHVKLSN